MVDSQAGSSPTLSKLDSDWRTARHAASGWPKFLNSVRLDGIRGWEGQRVEFRFPVVAIAGENGAGKSTILKSIAASYEVGANGILASAHTFSPDDFFPNTPWETVSGVVLEFEYRQGLSTTNGSLRKPSHRWRGMPERPERVVYFLDISRTQPVDTLIGYGRLARLAIAKDSEPVLLTDSNRQALSRVMSRTYEVGELNRDATGKQVGVLTVQGRRYSNFHQGAGEDTVMDLVALLQNAPRHSLVIIDEVEASLHPRAQRRLMTELIKLATSKRLQLVVSTHSEYVLEQLPAEARLYVTTDRTGRKEIIYGATPQYALGLMDDNRHPELDIYCEDAEAAYLVESLLRFERPDSVQRSQVIPVGPASTVKVMGGLSAAGRLPRNSVAVLDADQDPSSGCLVLPGDGPPEKVVFRSLDDTTWTTVAERLGVRPGDLIDAAADALRDDLHHTWARRIADSLSSTFRASKVWESAVDVWIRDVLTPAQVRDFVDQLLIDLPNAELSAEEELMTLDIPSVEIRR